MSSEPHTSDPGRLLFLKSVNVEELGDVVVMQSRVVPDQPGGRVPALSQPRSRRSSAGRASGGNGP